MFYYENYFLIALFLFLLLFIIITIFGYSIFIILDKRSREEHLSLTIILKSFGIGFAFNLIYLMVIVTLRIFNFFTVYLPFVIYDIVFIIYFWRKRIFNREKINRNWKERLIEYFKQNGSYLLILVIIFLLLILLQPYFHDNILAYQAYDPYHWYRHSWFLHEYHYLNFEDYVRPPGFILSLGFYTAITDDYYIFYFCMKFFPLFLMMINVLVMFAISKEFFKEKKYVILALVTFISFSYLIERYAIPLTSNLATTFGFLLLLFMKESITSSVITNDRSMKDFTKQTFLDKNLLYKGLILAGIFMAHALNFLYYFTFYFTFEMLILIRYFIKNRSNFRKKFQVFKKFMLISLVIIIFTVLLIIPGLVAIASYSNKGFKLFTDYIRSYFPFFNNGITLRSNPIFSILLPIGGLIVEFALSFFIYPIYKMFKGIFTEGFKDIPILNTVWFFYSLTLGIGIVLIIVGILIKFHRKYEFNKKQTYMISFFKFTFIGSFLFFGLIEYFGFIQIEFFQILHEFFFGFRKRLFEVFSGFWAIIFVYSFKYIVDLFRRSVSKIKNQKKLNQKNFLKVLRLGYICLFISVGGFIYVTTFPRTYDWKTYDDDRVEVVLFIGNYFNENPPEKNISIIVEDSTERIVYALIFYQNILIIQFDFHINQTYSNFRIIFDENNCEYVLVPKNDLNDNFQEKITNDFDFLYQNSKFAFIRIK